MMHYFVTDDHYYDVAAADDEYEIVSPTVERQQYGTDSKVIRYEPEDGMHFCYSTYYYFELSAEH